MFARVITAQADAERVDDAVELARRQLPAARQRPGFQGYQLLSNAETRKLVIISFWETRKQMREGVNLRFRHQRARFSDHERACG
jgi:heme-degrading monooxygenase HmoA